MGLAEADRLLLSGNDTSANLGLGVELGAIFMAFGAAIMQYVAVDNLGMKRVGKYDALVDVVEVPRGIALVEKAHLAVGIPAAMFYGAVAEEVEA